MRSETTNITAVWAIDHSL